MIDFDPWTATLAQAQERPNAYGPQGAVSQNIAAHGLTAFKEKIVNGDGFGVLEAVANCAIHGLVMPDWLASAYLKRYRAVQQCRVDSWDSEKSFGKPYPKGMQISAKRRQRINRINVINAVASAIDHNPERPLDVAFWDEIGVLIGEGKSNAQKLHTEAVRLGFAVSPSVRKNKLIQGT